MNWRRVALPSRMMAGAVLAAAIVAITSIYASAKNLSPFPVAGTTLFASAVVVESLVLLVLLRSRRPRSLWLRALIAAVAGVVALWFSAQDTAGAPEYVFMHQRWLAALIIGCLALLVASGIAEIRRHFAARREI